MTIYPPIMASPMSSMPSSSELSIELMMSSFLSFLELGLPLFSVLQLSPVDKPHIIHSSGRCRSVSTAVVLLVINYLFL